MTIEIRLSFSGDERKIKMVGFYRPVDASYVFLCEVCHLKTFFHVFLVGKVVDPGNKSVNQITVIILSMFQYKMPFYFLY